MASPSSSDREKRIPSPHATLQDVARAADVSTKTVSRVVNNEPRVAEKTRKRIQKVIRDIGYHPHIGARALRTERRDCIGINFPVSLKNVPVSVELLSFIFSHLHRLFGSRGIILSFDFPQEAEDSDIDYSRGLWSRRYGGLFILGPLKNGDPIIHRIHESGSPYLVTSRIDSLPECSIATVNIEEGAYQSTRYLIERGHRRIAMLQTFGEFNPGRERIRGYSRALEEAGIEFDERLIRNTNFASHQITSLVHRLLMEPGVTALIDSSVSEDAESIREGLRRAGRSIGDDIDVLCWTYTCNGAVMAEACAHTWIPIREAAVEGLREFAEWFANEREGPVNVLYQPTLYETKGLKEISKPRPVFDLFS